MHKFSLNLNNYNNNNKNNNNHIIDHHLNNYQIIAIAILMEGYIKEISDILNQGFV